MSDRSQKSVGLFASTLAVVAGATALAQTDGVRTKEITTVSQRASVVLDRNCPDIVQPYTLADNTASLAVFGAKEALTDIGTRLLSGAGGLLQGRPPLTPASGKLSASTKLAAKQLNWLPMTAEVAYGERLHQDEDSILDRDSKLGQKYYPVADKMLNEILAGVGQAHEYQFKMFLLKNSSRNAVARPGGFLYLDQGLIDDPAQWPKAHFAIAHEVAHVLQRHETKEIQSNIVDSISSRDDLVRVVTGSRGDPNAILSYIRIEKNHFTRHHVDQELQADSCAARLLSRSLTDPQALAASIEAFVNDLPTPEQGSVKSMPQSDEGRLAQTVHDIVDTPVKRHPNNQERLQNLRSIQSELSAGIPPKRP